MLSELVVSEVAPAVERGLLGLAREYLPFLGSGKAAARTVIVDGRTVDVDEAIRTNAYRDFPPTTLLHLASDELDKLVKSLAPGIKSRQWSSVVADDVSGRTVGRVIWNQMRWWSRDHNLGLPPHLIFMVPDSTTQTGARVANIGRSLDLDRSLIATEHIANGFSVSKIAFGLKSNGVRFDIASLCTSATRGSEVAGRSVQDDSLIFFGRHERYWRNPLYAGTKPLLRAAIGVEKQQGSATAFALRLDQQPINEFRTAIDEMSLRLYERHFLHTPPGEV